MRTNPFGLCRNADAWSRGILVPVVTPARARVAEAPSGCPNITGSDPAATGLRARISTPSGLGSLSGSRPKLRAWSVFNVTRRGAPRPSGQSNVWLGARVVVILRFGWI